MKDAKFILIENDPSDLSANIARLIALGVPERSIWPKANSMGLSGIGDAKNKLAQLRLDGWDPKTEKIVLLMDLSLDSNDSDWLATIEALERAASYFCEYVLVVCTRHPEHVAKDINAFVMGYMNKQLLSESAGGNAYFGKVIRSAVARYDKRRGISSSLNLADHCVIEDTLGLRLFEQAFGPFALIALAEMVSEGRAASIPIAKIATGGYSGTFVVLIELSLPNAGSRRFAAKIGRNKEELVDEYKKILTVSAARHKFAELPISTVDEVKPLLGFEDENIYVLLQHYSEGITLEQQVLEGGSSGLAASITNALRDMTERGIDDAHEVEVSRILGISKESVFRFESNFKSIKLLLPSFGEIRGFNSHFKAELNALDRLHKAVVNWSSFLDYSLPKAVIGFEQHGDLNPRNILVEKLNKSSYRLKLIDFARFGVWPAFYDLSRLRLQIALRFADSPDLMADQFPNRILDWDDAAKSASIKASSSKRKDANLSNFVLFNSSLTSLIDARAKKLEAQDANVMSVLLPVLEIFDLIKMACYQDASWAKRTWFLLLAARRVIALEKTLGIFHAKTI